MFGAGVLSENEPLLKRPKQFRVGCCGCLQFLCEDPVELAEQDDSVLGIAEDASIINSQPARPQSFLNQQQ